MVQQTPHNLHLLKKMLSVREYEILKNRDRYRVLPEYITSRCPFCDAEIIEKLNTYTLRGWPGLSSPHRGTAIFDQESIVYHCPHFVHTQPFVNFHGSLPDEGYNGLFGPEVPHILGYLLDDDEAERSFRHLPANFRAALDKFGFPDCRAVIHAVPVCRIEEDPDAPADDYRDKPVLPGMSGLFPDRKELPFKRQIFVPRDTMFIVTHFSDNPQAALKRIRAFNADFHVPPNTDLIHSPPDGRQHWYDLSRWAAAEKMYWLTPRTLDLCTGSNGDFPYGVMQGRTLPYLMRYDRRAQQLEEEERVFQGTKPHIIEFLHGRVISLDDADLGPKLGLIWWESPQKGFSFPVTVQLSLAHYCLPPDDLYGEGAATQILTQDIRAFSLRDDPSTGLIEVVLTVGYPPGERTLGLVDPPLEDEAYRWVSQANALLASIQQRSAT